jgi:hypothetical protein
MNLTKAIVIATIHHENVMDKSGLPYIYHPLRVMDAVKHFGDEYAMVAVMHDIIEDPDQAGRCYSINELREVHGFDKDVIQGIEAVTRRGVHGSWKETYKEFVRRAAEHPIGLRVKIADIEDNRKRLFGPHGLKDESAAKGLDRRYGWSLEYLYERVRDGRVERVQPKVVRRG